MSLTTPARFSAAGGAECFGCPPYHCLMVSVSRGSSLKQHKWRIQIQRAQAGLLMIDGPEAPEVVSHLRSFFIFIGEVDLHLFRA